MHVLQTGKQTPRDESWNMGLQLLMATVFFQEIAYFLILLDFLKRNKLDGNHTDNFYFISMTMEILA